jgi:Fur family ferric uptake transcriptional regulator
MDIQKIISNNNIKPTSARIELLEVLQSAKKPLSYEMIKEHISMDKATFYRNITKFEQTHIISSFESSNKRYFEFISSPHAHFICKYCDTVECIDQSFDTNILDYEVEDVIFKGKCRSCQ